jgi:hypothetical protein
MCWASPSSGPLGQIKQLRIGSERVPHTARRSVVCWQLRVRELPCAVGELLRGTGCSYLPSQVPTLDEMVPVYTQLATAMEPYVDLYLAETMSTSREVRTSSSTCTTSC